MLITDFEIYPRRANQTHQCMHCYTKRPLDYYAEYNSWGFRDIDFEKYVGMPVNICLGDSFTVNQGDTVENSWPRQLAVNLELPTLNLGLDGAGNDSIRIIYDRACKVFDVKNTFVMYSYFFRRLENKKLVSHRDYSLETNILYFQDNYIKHAYYTFIPEWCWRKEEVDYLQKEHINHLPDCYVHWELPLTEKIKHRIFHLKDKKLNLFNDDLHHMSKDRNKQIADYFLGQYKVYA